MRRVVVAGDATDTLPHQFGNHKTGAHLFKHLCKTQAAAVNAPVVDAPGVAGAFIPSLRAE